MSHRTRLHPPSMRRPLPRGAAIRQGKKGQPKTASLPRYLVPEVGIEPTRAQGSEDFESSASTSFTTPAYFRLKYPNRDFLVNRIIRACA